jgi:hypothetical protein
MTPAVVVRLDLLRRLLDVRTDLDAAIEVADAEDLPALVEARFRVEQQIRRARGEDMVSRCA